MTQPSQSNWHHLDFKGLTPEKRKEVAEQIATERKKRRITQEDLARLADVPARTISSMENGTTPHTSTLRKLAAALDSTPRGRPDDASIVQMFTDVTAPMYLRLSDRGRAQALRDIVLLLGTALEHDRADEPEGTHQP